MRKKAQRSHAPLTPDWSTTDRTQSIQKLVAVIVAIGWYTLLTGFALVSLLMLTGCEEGGLIDVLSHVDTPTVYSPASGTTVHVGQWGEETVTFSWSTEAGADHYVLKFYREHGGSKTLAGSKTIYPTGGGTVSYPKTFDHHDAGQTLRWSVTAWDYDYQDDDGDDWWEVSDPTSERVLYVKE